MYLRVKHEKTDGMSFECIQGIWRNKIGMKEFWDDGKIVGSWNGEHVPVVDDVQIMVSLG